MVGQLVVRPLVLWVGLWVLTAAAAALLALLIGARVSRRRRERRTRAVVGPLRPLLLELASGDDPGHDARRPLVAATGSTGAAVDASILELLAKIRGESVQPLVEVLRQHGVGRRAVTRLGSRSSVRRANAVWTLGVMRERAAAAEVLVLLHDPSQDVMITAARALGMMGDPMAAGPILEAVAPSDAAGGLPPWIAVEAVVSLGTDTTSDVCAALEHRSVDVRMVAALIISQVPLVAAAGMLRRAIAVETEPRLLATLTVALGAVGSPRDVELLGSLLRVEHPQEVRRAAVGAIADLRHLAALPWLAPLLHSVDLRVAELAALTLVSVGPAGRAAVSAVAESGVLSTSSRLCRYAVAQDSLGRSRVRGAS